MASETLYAGPGKLYYNSKGIFPEGEGGMIKVEVEEGSDEVASGFHGRVTETAGDAVVKISLTPFDHWGLLATLYPARVTTPAKGTRAHGASGSPVSAKVWSPDGRLYNVLRTAVSKHPDMHLGAGKALFGPMELLGIFLYNKDRGDAAGLLSITESAAADPGGAMALTDFIREPWTLAWNSLTWQAEEEWVVSFDVKYSRKTVQKLTRIMEQDSVKIMIKGRPVGSGTHTNLLTQTGVQDSRTAGKQRATGSLDAVLTSASGKTITLKNADQVGAGYEFGGSKLGTGEIGFVNGMTFTAGAVDPLIIFSA